MFQKIQSKMAAHEGPLFIEGGEGGGGARQLVSINVIFVGTNLILISILRNHMKINCSFRSSRALAVYMRPVPFKPMMVMHPLVTTMVTCSTIMKKRYWGL